MGQNLSASAAVSHDLVERLDFCKVELRTQHLQLGARASSALRAFACRTVAQPGRSNRPVRRAIEQSDGFRLADFI